MSAQADTTTDSEIKVTEPKKYTVVMHNDNTTPMDFVMALLMQLFHKAQDDAIYITLEIHHNGSGIAGIYSLEIAKEKVIEGVKIATANGYELKLTYEEA